MSTKRVCPFPISRRLHISLTKIVIISCPKKCVIPLLAGAGGNVPPHVRPAATPLVITVSSLFLSSSLVCLVAKDNLVGVCNQHSQCHEVRISLGRIKLLRHDLNGLPRQLQAMSHATVNNRFTIKHPTHDGKLKRNLAYFYTQILWGCLLLSCV